MFGPSVTVVVLGELRYRVSRNARAAVVLVGQGGCEGLTARVRSAITTSLRVPAPADRRRLGGSAAVTVRTRRGQTVCEVRPRWAVTLWRLPAEPVARAARAPSVVSQPYWHEYRRSERPCPASLSGAVQRAHW